MTKKHTSNPFEDWSSLTSLVASGATVGLMASILPKLLQQKGSTHMTDMERACTSLLVIVLQRLERLEGENASLSAELEKQRRQVGDAVDLPEHSGTSEAHAHRLGDALRRVLVRAGVLHQDAIVTGPGLLTAAEDYAASPPTPAPTLEERLGELAKLLSMEGAEKAEAIQGRLFDQRPFDEKTIVDDLVHDMLAVAIEDLRADKMTLTTEMLSHMSDTAGVGRDVLESRIRVLCEELHGAQSLLDTADARARAALIIEGCLTCRGGAEYQAMLANLTAVQARGSSLMTENRAQRMAAASLVDPQEWETAVAKAMAELTGSHFLPINHHFSNPLAEQIAAARPYERGVIWREGSEPVPAIRWRDSGKVEALTVVPETVPSQPADGAPQPLTTEEEANLRASAGETVLYRDVARIWATLDAERAAKGILLPGWTCTCGCFNGSAKELRSTCRACGAARPT